MRKQEDVRSESRLIGRMADLGFGHGHPCSLFGIRSRLLEMESRIFLDRRNFNDEQVSRPMGRSSPADVVSASLRIRSSCCRQCTICPSTTQGLYTT
jgi:hypothetical protein